MSASDDRRVTAILCAAAALCAVLVLLVARWLDLPIINLWRAS